MSFTIDWGAALALAAARGVAPDAFWRLSVLEWRALCAPRTAPALSRSELDALMHDHPDG